VDDPFIVEVDGAELTCYRKVIDPDGYTVVHFHGNGESVSDYVPDLADVFARMGLNSLFVEFREYGGSTGEAQLVAMLGDGAAAIAAAGVVPEKVIAFGRSIGSLYAIELAHRHPEIGGLIIESGIADPAERFLTYADLAATGIDESDVVAELKRHFNHNRKLSGYGGLADPTHGTRWTDRHFTRRTKPRMGREFSEAACAVRNGRS
jgi:pimeloyl-ACP methyl ester carboxylesterase